VGTVAGFRHVLGVPLARTRRDVIEFDGAEALAGAVRVDEREHVLARFFEAERALGLRGWSAPGAFLTAGQSC
jgi:hypothetical protein